MDRLALMVNYGGTAIRTFLFNRRVCWLECEVNAAFGQNRSLVDDARAIRGVDYEVLCQPEANELASAMGGLIIVFETGLALAASDREERATHLRGLLLAVAEFRSQVEHLGVYERKP